MAFPRTELVYGDDRSSGRVDDIENVRVHVALDMAWVRSGSTTSAIRHPRTSTCSAAVCTPPCPPTSTNNNVVSIWCCARSAVHLYQHVPPRTPIQHPQCSSSRLQRPLLPSPEHLPTPRLSRVLRHPLAVLVAITRQAACEPPPPTSR